MKEYIIIGVYFGHSPWVEIGKYPDAETALEENEDNGSDPVVMEHEKFKKLYKKALKGGK